MIPRITITADQGWGKGWLAVQIAQKIAAWKSGVVEVYDNERGRDTGSPTEVYGRDGKPVPLEDKSRVVARIIVRHAAQ